MSIREIGFAFFILLLIVPFPASRAPIGEIITGGEGEVLVSGVRVAWGSTVFSGSEIRTSSSTAIIRLSQEAGVLSINGASRVRLSREKGRVVAELYEGSVVIRANVATRILALGRTIESDQPNLYSVDLADSEPVVRTVWNPVRVSFGGKLLTVVAESAGSLAEPLMAQLNGPTPEPAAALAVTPRGALFVDCKAVRTGCTLTVMNGPFGVLSFGNPVTGAGLNDFVTFRRRSRQVIGAGTSGAGGTYAIVHALNPTQCAAAMSGGSVRVLARLRNLRAAGTCSF